LAATWAAGLGGLWPAGNPFTGRSTGANRRDAAAKDIDHLIGAEERFQLMMMRQ